jgi:hypothetical protein
MPGKEAQPRGKGAMKLGHKQTKIAYHLSSWLQQANRAWHVMMMIMML